MLKVTPSANTVVTGSSRFNQALHLWSLVNTSDNRSMYDDTIHY